VEEDEDDSEINWEEVLGQRSGEPEDSWFSTSKEETVTTKEEASPKSGNWFQVVRETKNISDLQNIIDIIENSKLFPPIESDLTPEGNYRAVLLPYSTDKFVVKLAKDPAGAQMNKEDFDLANAFPIVMAKCFDHHPNFLWVIMERIKPVQIGDRALMQKILDKSFKKEQDAFLEFFRNLNQEIVNFKRDLSSKVKGLQDKDLERNGRFRNQMKNKLMDIASDFNQRINLGVEDDEDRDDLYNTNLVEEIINSEIFRKYKDPMIIFKEIVKAVKIERDEDGLLIDVAEVWHQKIRDAAGPTWHELAKAITTFGISIREVREKNIGCDQSFNFKLLDSSIESTMQEAG
jgi:hypothetical protein